MRRGLAVLIIVVLAFGLFGMGVALAAPEQQASGSRILGAPPVISLGEEGWSDPLAGTWDPSTRLATLTRDLPASIRIDADGVALDGNGHTLTGNASGNGVEICERMDVTVSNLTVRGFANGFYVSGSAPITLTNNTASGNANGFHLCDQASGNLLSGNTANENDFGIYLAYSDRARLVDNVASQNRFQGIHIERCSFHTLQNNTADANTEDGIQLQASHFSMLSGNRATNNGQYGLRIDSSCFDTLSGNEMAGNAMNFRLEGTTTPENTHTIDATNRVDGKAILYLKDLTGGTYDASSDAGTLYLVNCSDLTIEGLTLTHNDAGILLWESHNITIRNVQATENGTGIRVRNSTGNHLSGNVCRQNARHGIWLETIGYGTVCESNTLSDNTAGVNGAYGFFIDAADNNTLTDNTSADNGHGMYLRDASANRICNNRMVSNRTAQAYATGGSGNLFHASKPVGGNHWSDWTTPDADGDGFVDEPYVFTGGQDDLPFAAEGTWTDTVAPTTSIEFAGTPGTNGWFRSRVLVTLTAVDNPGGSGVESIAYSLDGENWQAYNGPFTIVDEGLTTIYYRATDKAGNVEQPGKDVPVYSTDFAGFDPSEWIDVDYLPRYTGRPQQLAATVVDGRNVLHMRTTEKTPPGDARRGIGTAASFAAMPEMAVEVALKPVGEINDLAEIWLFSRATGQYVRFGLSSELNGASRLASAEISGYGGRVSGDGVFSPGEWLIARIESEPGKTVISLLDAKRAERWSTTFGVALRDLFGDFNLTLSQHLGLPYAATWDLTAYVDYVQISRVDRVCRSEVVRIDQTPPLVQLGAPSPAPNAAGWNNTDVTIPFTAEDGVSGVACSEPANPLVLSAEGRAVNGTVTVTDAAGNSTTVTTPAFMIDKTPPAIAGVPTSEPSAYGWYNSNVTVRWEVTDELSGVDPDGLPADSLLTEEGTGQTAGPVIAVDLAGNRATASLEGIHIDKTAPTLEFGTPSPAANTAGWNNTDVSIPLKATDGLSGLAPESPAGPVVLTAEGRGVSAQVTVMDKAGNSTTLSSPMANIDKTAPKITAAATTPSGAYTAGSWTREDVTVRFACSDALSGLLEEPAPVVVTTEGAGQTASATCADQAGNTASVIFEPINIDRTPPRLVGHVSPEPNAAGWNNTSVIVTFEGADDLSGLASVPAPTTVSMEGEGMAVIGTAVDQAGNTVSATVGNINIDMTPPEILVRTPQSGERLTTATRLDYEAHDALSGVASLTGSVDQGRAAVAVTSGELLQVGDYALTVLAVDAAGNVARETRRFTVANPAGYSTGSGYLRPGHAGPPGKGKGNGNGKANGKGWGRLGDGRVVFSYTCRYKHREAVPSSRWPFMLAAPDLSFVSSSYDRLTIDGAVARFQGSGRVNGRGDYGFTVTAVDGKLAVDGTDRIRVRIWDKASGRTIFDNEPGTPDLAVPVTEVVGRIAVRDK